MNRKKGKRRRISTGFLLWGVIALFILAVFLFNSRNIQRVVETTGFFEAIRERFGGNTQEEPILEQIEPPQQESNDVINNDTQSIAIVAENAEPSTLDTAVESEIGADGEAVPANFDRANQQSDSELEPADEQDATPIEQQTESPEARLLSTIYYIQIDEAGRAGERGVRRVVRHQNNPLTRSIQELLAGPTAEEVNAGLLSLIPSETRLLSANIRGNVAYLNFNDAFLFNSLGVEGGLAQLRQVVYSATEFDTVDRVQIMIDGEIAQYLGGEGIYIGDPIGRGSFR